MTARTSAEILAERAGLTGQAPPTMPGESSAQRLATRVVGTSAPWSEVRRWAREHGYPISAHGPISRSLIEEFEAARRAGGGGMPVAEGEDYIAPGSVYL